MKISTAVIEKQNSIFVAKCAGTEPDAFAYFIPPITAGLSICRLITIRVHMIRSNSIFELLFFAIGLSLIFFTAIINYYFVPTAMVRSAS